MSRSLIVVPCYNEARRLDLSSFRNFLERKTDAIQFLFVDDGSTDDTLTVLAELQRAHPEAIDVFPLSQNQGKAEAVRQGFLQAATRDIDFVGFWDADLATPLEAISDFCRLLEENPSIDVVFGSRVQLLGRSIERSTARHYLGRMFATTVSLVLGLKVYDTQCGAKLFRAHPDTFTLFREPFATRWIFDVEIIARMIRAEQEASTRPSAERIYECPLAHWRDVQGSKLKSTDFLKAIYELLRLRLTYFK